MAIFLTKTWGWEVPVGPLQFSTEGWRRNAVEQLQPGDEVVIVGTRGDQTPEEMRGRILGVMEPTREPVMSLDFAMQVPPEHFSGGEYKWPFGLNNLRAWSIPERPLLTNVINRRFSMAATRGIIRLTEEEAAAVSKLGRREVGLVPLSAQAHRRMAICHGAARRTAPPPTTTRRGVMHLRRAEAYTYAMEIIQAKASSFKVGWAFDVRQRARQFNHSAMPFLGGVRV